MNVGISGSRDFAGLLGRCAAELADPRVAAIAAWLAAPLQVAVAGRRGAGRRTVARALECAETAITSQQQADLADVVVYVVVEVVKPEDSAAVAALRGSGRPVLVVANKSDLTGCAGAADAAALIGVPVDPMAALLAVAAVDGLTATLWAALQRSVAESQPLSEAVRQQLCDTLDLPGIDHALAAVRQGCSFGQVQALLRQLSGVDAVALRLSAAGAMVRYRRLLDAVAQLEALAAGDGRIGEFLAGNPTVLARMVAAGEVVAAAGVAFDALDAVDAAAARLRAAARWQRYSRGPVNALHHACGTDLARGLLRLWSMELV